MIQGSTTGITAVDSAVLWAVVITAIAAALAVLWRLIRGIRRVVARVNEVVDDWQGIPSRPGVRGRPGVMDRLGGIEERLERVEHELHPNSGGSLRDVVDRVEQAVSPPSA